jgi:hypothetical protein
MRSVVSREPVHILLTGPPACLKTVFLLEMLEGLDNAYFIDAIGASKAGMVNHLFESDTKSLAYSANTRRWLAGSSLEG